MTDVSDIEEKPDYELSLMLSITPKGEYDFFLMGMDAAWSFMPEKPEGMCNAIRFIFVREKFGAYEFGEEAVKQMIEEAAEELIEETYRLFGRKIVGGKGSGALDDILYSVSDVAKLMKVGKNRIYDLIHAGLLPVLKIGGLKIRKESLEKFLENYEGCDLTDPYNVKQVCEMDFGGSD